MQTEVNQRDSAFQDKISNLSLLSIVASRLHYLSLESRLFTDDWKSALVLPLLKKPGLYKNYRPVSNLQYFSKLTEKMVFDQITPI